MKRRAASVAAIVLMLTATFPAAAHAAPPDIGAWQEFKGPQLNSTYRSYGYASWSASSGEVEIVTTAYNMASGWCVTTYFDWLNVGHHDGRATRDCTSGGGNGNGVWNDGGWSQVGVDKLGVCYDTDNHIDGCTSYPDASIAPMPKNWNIGVGVLCISWVKRKADGYSQYNGAGDPNSCTA